MGDELGKRIAGLEARLLQNISYQPAINLTREGENLELELVLSRSLDGYETVILNRDGSKLSVAYEGMFNTAFATFLNEKYTQEIKKSTVLSQFKQETSLKKTQGQFVTQERGETYCEKFCFKKEATYAEAEAAMMGIQRIFEDKAVTN